MTTKTELTQNDILCTKATLVHHKSTSDNSVLKFAISQAADMLECLAEILRESTMRSCRDCLSARMCKTDHPVSEMIFTRQGYKCKFHAERWKRKDKLRRCANE